MITQAYFQNIRTHIKLELIPAKHSIYVAVAWFTDRHLFKILCDKAKAGIEVQLIVMDDDITRNCSIDFNELEYNGGKLYMVNNSYGILMHNKFCIIDEKTIITGSYNWSMKAASNHENITITNDAESLAFTFITEFKRIKEAYHGKEILQEIDHTIVNKRLVIIDGLIQLEEQSDILPHIIKLKEYNLPTLINDILIELESAKWITASNLIKDYLKKSQTLALFDDIQIEKLKWKIKYLELEIVALENEKSMISKIISDFLHEYTIRFGEILSLILKLKKEKLKSINNERFEEFTKAENNYNEFKENYNKHKELNKEYNYLNDNEKDELKRKYRKAASICHPDIVANKFPNDLEKQKKAEELFKILNDANSKNDLKTVIKILTNLENGIFDFQQDDNTISINISVLEERINYLKEKLEILKIELIRLRSDNNYKKVLNIKDFEVFYKEEEDRLKIELNELINYV